MVIGENGIFSKANIAKEKTHYSSAKEILDVKLLDIQSDCAKEGKAYNIKEITDNIELSSEEQIILEKYYYGSTSKIKDGITRDTTKSVIGIVVSVREYPKYKFLIGEEGKIKGVTTATDIDSMSITDFDTIEGFEKEKLGITTNTEYDEDDNTVADYTENLLYRTKYSKMKNGQNGVTIPTSGVTINKAENYATFNGTGNIAVDSNIIDVENKLSGTANKTLTCWYRTNTYKDSDYVCFGELGSDGGYITNAFFDNKLWSGVGYGRCDCGINITDELDNNWHFVVSTYERR